MDPTPIQLPDASRPLRLAIVGPGDVWHRHYEPPLRSLAPEVEIAAFVEPSPSRGAGAVEGVASWSPNAVVVPDVAALATWLAGRRAASAAPTERGIDAAVNLTPAPLHGPVNQELLEAGLHSYSEKPLAHSLADADRLIETARREGLLFQCAPGTAVTARMRWLRDLVGSGRFGRPTLAVAHHADPGPAAWREYTGDPTPFYRDGVGPLFDHGVYRLHELTFVMGPVRRVQAMGSIGVARRRVRGGPLTGRSIDVTTPDHVLVHLEFAEGGLGQLLASFGTPETLAPWLEVHFPMATLSFGGKSWEPDAPVSLYEDDDGPAATEGWRTIEVPRDSEGTVETGIRHFVEVLRGRAEPALSPEHARHVLDVMLRTYDSIADGAAHPVQTTFTTG